MTKKDYEQIAAILWLATPVKPQNEAKKEQFVKWQGELAQWRITIALTCTTLSAKNSRFDEMKFRAIVYEGPDVVEISNDQQ
jgi:hypothetical protein